MDKNFINIAGKTVSPPDNFKDVIWRPSAYALVRNDEGKVLVMRNGVDRKYGLPGGGAELTESMQECAVRETYEETGYVIEVETQPLYTKEMMFYNELQNTYNHSLGFFFKAHVINDSEGGQIFDKEDSVAVEWVKLEDTKKEDWCHWYWPVVEKIMKCEIKNCGKMD